MSSLIDQYGKALPPSVNKTILERGYATGHGAYSNDGSKRGATVYSSSQLQQMTGRDKDGRLVSWGVEHPYFYLTLQQRIEIFRLSTPVFGVVSSRMKKLSGLNFNVTTEKYKEDEIVQELKDKRAVYNEYKESVDLQDLTLKAMLYKEVLQTLPEVKPDFSNFDSSLLRWKRRIKNKSLVEAEYAKEWLMEPNNGTTWEEFICKWEFDRMIHGTTAVYKDIERGRLENFDILPGGSVFKVKKGYFSGVNGYIQVTPGYGFGGYGQAEPQVYFGDEIVYSEYLPTSARNYSMIPLEALINKVAESLLFDKLMADQADGTKVPEKIIIVTEQNPFGSLDDNDKFDMPLDVSEQRKIEQKVNTPVKGAVMTFSGNRVEVVDMSRENTMQIQMERQKEITKDVALVFNMSNMEINQTDSAGTSGRATSEAQAEIEQGKGIAPEAKALTGMVNKGLLPFRFGQGLKFEFELSKNEREEKELDLLALQTGEFTKNEIRDKYGKEGFGEEYDKPEGSVLGQAGENELNPMFTRGV